MNNPTGAENAQAELLEDSEEFDLKAREIVVSHCGYVHGSLKRKIATALHEAEQRGMMRAVDYLKGAGKQHRELVPVLLKTSPAMAEMQKIRAEECEGNAQAIERAAKEEK